MKMQSTQQQPEILVVGEVTFGCLQVHFFWLMLKLTPLQALHQPFNASFCLILKQPQNRNRVTLT